MACQRRPRGLHRREAARPGRFGFGSHYAQAFPSVGPERRKGRAVLGFTRIDEKPITDHSQVYTCDTVVVIDETLLETVDVTKGLKEGGRILINTKAKANRFPFRERFPVPPPSMPPRSPRRN